MVFSLPLLLFPFNGHIPLFEFCAQNHKKKKNHQRVERRVSYCTYVRNGTIHATCMLWNCACMKVSHCSRRHHDLIDFGTLLLAANGIRTNPCRACSHLYVAAKETRSDIYNIVVYLCSFLYKLNALLYRLQRHSVGLSIIDIRIFDDKREC